MPPCPSKTFRFAVRTGRSGRSGKAPWSCLGPHSPVLGGPECTVPLCRHCACVKGASKLLDAALFRPRPAFLAAHLRVHLALAGGAYARSRRKGAAVLQDLSSERTVLRRWFACA